MNVRVREISSGVVTIAYFKPHTMSRTLRRYPPHRYEYLGGDFAAESVRLASSKWVPTRFRAGRR